MERRLLVLKTAADGAGGALDSKLLTQLDAQIAKMVQTYSLGELTIIKRGFGRSRFEGPTQTRLQLLQLR